MKQNKRVLRPERLRHLPSRFSWVDQQLVRGGHCLRCNAPALALYLFLLTVADAQGLSYYSDDTLADYLPLEDDQLAAARQLLIDADLVAYQKPLYQVLSLPEANPSGRTGQTLSVAQLLQRALNGGGLQ